MEGVTPSAISSKMFYSSVDMNSSTIRTGREKMNEHFKTKAQFERQNELFNCSRYCDANQQKIRSEHYSILDNSNESSERNRK